MNLKTRIITTLLAVLMILSAFTCLTVSVGAAEVDTSSPDKIAEYYLKTNVYKTPEEKLASMELMLKNDKYEFYVDSVSGEVALYEPGTDNFLFSNPYDVASSKGSDMFTSSGNAGTKEQLLMSQVIINYLDNGTSKPLYSFADAAMKKQINVSRIKSGVRIEYTIGREEFRKLVPRWIPVDVFDELIKQPLLKAVEGGAMGGVPKNQTAADNFYFKQFMTYYQLKDPDKEETQGAIDAMYKAYPITKEMPIYVFTTDASAVEINKVEGYIKDYCSDTYSFEQMDIDHETTGYEATDEEYPVFKLALEYSLDGSGLSVRLPCNGLQYNTARYTLENISILPYMGAGNTKNEGYNFYPDGSGSLFDFNLNKNESFRSKIYGTDYAYHQISGKYQKAVRVPVYGTVAEEIIYNYGYEKVTTDADGNEIIETHPNVVVSATVQSKEQIEELLASDNVTVLKPLTESRYDRGYVAVIESGESLGEIETYYAGALSDYATMSNYFNPKPKDSYDIADSISVTSSSMWTVVSNRKYTGNIRIHYQMLDGAKYDETWLGMANAYRDYLLDKKVLTKLTAEDVQADSIPLYMEVFGALETQQTIATIPVDVMTPLTTFEDILTMYGELSAKGAKNVNFKLTGFANGGMYASVPSSVKWESAVGGKSGFRDLVASATEINGKGDGSHLGLFPDFDFAYCGENSMFDSLVLKDDAIKTIDNRYTSLRQYSATQQKYVSFFQLAISPSRYSKFYEKLMETYERYGVKTMSVASLGSALNSDFDEDEPYNREDNKDFTVKAFEDLSANYSLMTDGGNAYTWGYVDYILNLDLDSSRFVKSCCSVPFLGAVLHGYMQFAGAPLNEEGDTDYAILKAIENGAGLYFVLSYRNTQELKEDEVLSQYYSIRYDIWRDDVISYYNTLNALLKDVQTKVIIDHKFLNYNSTDENGNFFFTERLLDSDELDREILEELKKAEEAAKEQERNEAINKIAAVAEARLALQNAIATLDEIVEPVASYQSSLNVFVNQTMGNVPTFTIKLQKSYVQTIGTYATDMLSYYSMINYRYALAEETMLELAEQLELIKDAKVGTSAEYQYNTAKAQYDAARAHLDALKAAQEAAFTKLCTDSSTMINSLFVEGSKSTSWLETPANKALADELVANLSSVTNVEALAKCLVDWTNKMIGIYNEQAADKGVSPIDKTLSFDAIKADGEYQPEVEVEEEETVEETTGSDRYHVNNNNVVSVTYGDVDENGNKVAYKTFILNYNNYAVRVTYKGIVYTVPAGGYVVPANN